MLGLERNQGWRAVRRGHADDAAGWFVSIGRLWRARGGSTHDALERRFDLCDTLTRTQAPPPIGPWRLREWFQNKSGIKCLFTCFPVQIPNSVVPTGRSCQISVDFVAGIFDVIVVSG